MASGGGTEPDFASFYWRLAQILLESGLPDSGFKPEHVLVAWHAAAAT